jgi:hypothetical protein
MKKEFNITEWVSKNRLKEHEGEEYPPYMFSKKGFGCHVCKYYYMKDKKHMCDNQSYKDYKGTAELVDNKGNQIEDPSKWCSNWFLPKE